MKSIKIILIGISLMLIGIGIYIFSNYVPISYDDGLFILFFIIGIIVTVIGSITRCN
ncbi:hypothetical protein acsn021_02900 [Anaerocolumna cellulosilytica]|uniref:Uncharacterized protein n=1 Tax=Anaerocolumna cellulosilytica TaxID=433286 RepID=A0A6S6R0F7_9FIRM|nr:putative membrane protein [Anaerocolumna cellulosilytica]BCJ92721.1 hypothetical protein acsn021_02900 [Anaerocolumna cellulosilytica]